MSGRAKETRRQLRNVVQEILPEIITQELVVAIRQQLQQENVAGLKLIEDLVKSTLNKIDQRSRDVQDYIVRQVTSATVPVETPKQD